MRREHDGGGPWGGFQGEVGLSLEGKSESGR